VAGTVRQGKIRLERAAVLNEDQPLTVASAEAIASGCANSSRRPASPGPGTGLRRPRPRHPQGSETPAVSEVEEAGLIRFQAVKELTDAPGEVVIDYVAGTGPVGVERRSLAVAVRKELLQAYQVMCDAAGLKLAALTPRPFALAAPPAPPGRRWPAPSPSSPAVSAGVSSP